MGTVKRLLISLAALMLLVAALPGQAAASPTLTISADTTRAEAIMVAQAAPGDLDPTFGLGGKVTTGPGRGYAVAIQSDGKLVVVGTASGMFAVARFNSDGTLDTSFDGDGKVTTDFGPGVEDAFSVAIQTDGKIVAAGSAAPDGFCCRFALTRYQTNGSLDATFGAAGVVTTPFGGRSEVFGLAVQPDGRIVAAGNTSSPLGDDFAVARYNEDGTLDANFDGDGRVTTDLGGWDAASGIAVRGDGKIVVAGIGGPTRDFALARYNDNGTLDAGFDEDGRVLTDFGDADFAEDVAIQQDGRIVAVGVPGSGSFALARYNDDGTLDNSFDGDGKLTTDFGGDDRGRALAIQTNGKIVAVGFSHFENNSRFAVARYNTDGSLDTNFGAGGLVTTDFGDPADVGVLCPPSLIDCSNDIAEDVAIQADGKIVAAGGAGACSPTCLFALARYEGDQANATPIGTHDGFEGDAGPYFCAAQGWAVDPDDPYADLNVRILSDGSEVASGFADLFRQDLLDAGVSPDGISAFHINLWGLVSLNVPHLITAQAQDTQMAEWVDLWATPKELTCVASTVESPNPKLAFFTADCQLRGTVFLESVFFANDNPNGGSGGGFRVIGENTRFIFYTPGTDRQADDVCLFGWTGGWEPKPPWNGTFLANVFVAPNEVPPAPNNDLRQQAIPIALGEVATLNTAGANTSRTDPQDCAAEPMPPSSHTVWYSFTAPADETYEVNTIGSDFDTTLFVLDSEGAVAACDDDIVLGQNVQSQAWFEGLSGRTYLIMIGSYGDTPGGNLVLTVVPG